MRFRVRYVGPRHTNLDHAARQLGAPDGRANVSVRSTYCDPHYWQTYRQPKSGGRVQEIPIYPNSVSHNKCVEYCWVTQSYDIDFIF